MSLSAYLFTVAVIVCIVIAVRIGERLGSRGGAGHAGAEHGIPSLARKVFLFDRGVERCCACDDPTRTCTCGIGPWCEHCGKCGNCGGLDFGQPRALGISSE